MTGYFITCLLFHLPLLLNFQSIYVLQLSLKFWAVKPVNYEVIAMKQPRLPSLPSG